MTETGTRNRLAGLAEELGPAAGVVHAGPRGAVPGDARHGRGPGRARSPASSTSLRHGQYHGPAARAGSRRPPVPASTSTPPARHRRGHLRRRRPGHLRRRPTSRTRGGRARLPYDSYDAVLTATALHWLHSEPLAALYGQIAELVRDGGVFMNADHMIDETTPRINAAERAQRHARMDQAKAATAPSTGPNGGSWPPRTRPRRAHRRAASRSTASTPTATCPSAGWHARVLREKGFGEARPVWCSPSDALVLALK